MPLNRLVLHIGRHKSGTSSLQHWLANNRALLHEQGILFPLSGGKNRIAHHVLAQQLHTRQSDGAGIDAIIEGIRSEVDGQDTLLLSSEAFQNIYDTGRLKGFVSALGIREVRVICYVREYLDYAISAFRQMVHNQPRFLTFSDYCGRFGDMAPFIARWRNVGDLNLAWYDRDLLIQGDVIRDFCNRAGIAAEDFQSDDKNPSIGGNLLAYKLAANKLSLTVGNYNSLLKLATEEPRFRTGFRIDDADAALAREGSEYNRSLFAELGEIRLKSWSNAPDLPDNVRLDADMELIAEQLGETATSEHIAAIRDSGDWFDPNC